MRDIKFRAWSEKYKQYLEDCSYPIGSDSSISIGLTDGPSILELGDYQDYSDDTHGYARYHDIGGIMLEQYTGLKDKNGVEIYEGDILSIKYQWIVIYKHDSFIVDSLHNNGFDFKSVYKLIKFRERAGIPISVEGNIHENHQLVTD